MADPRPVIRARLRDGLVVGIDRFAAGGHEALAVADADPTRALPALARGHPGAAVAWIDEVLVERVASPDSWAGRLRHPLEVLHLGRTFREAENAPDMGLLHWDAPALVQAPEEGRFPTWLVSSAAGVTSAELLAHLDLDEGAPSFRAALLDFGYRGWRAGAFAYHEPALLAKAVPAGARACLQGRLTDAEAAWLVRRMKGRKWIPFWALARARAGLGLPVKALVCGVLDGMTGRGGGSPAPVADPSALAPGPASAGAPPRVDALIPTLGRPTELADVVRDLAAQTVPPTRVLVVHQDLPGTGVTRAAVEEALAGSWPFEVVLSTSDRVGACRARNLGLARVEADWIFLLDDDVRLPPRCLEHLHGTAVAYGVEAVCAAVYIPRLESVPTDIRVRSWPSLPSGAAFVSRRAAQEAGGFDERLEHGWGEDYEWGIRLRLAGTEVALTSHEPVQHLKAETGGFRAPIRRPWDDDPVRPRPAPTVVLSRRLHASREMRTGYRLFYALSRLGRTAWWRWPREVVRIPGEFRRALHWATELEEGGVRDTGGRG